MALKNPHIQDVSYVHPKDYYDGRDAAAVIRYLVRRPDDKRNPAGGAWRSVPREHRVGDAKAFKAAAEKRTRAIWNDAKSRGKTLAKNKAYWCTSYLHIVISPANRGGLSPASLKALARPWTADGNGETIPHFGVIHTDGRRGKHLHLVLVRDKLDACELRDLKAKTDGMAMRLGPERTLEQEMSRELKQTTAFETSMGRGRETGHSIEDG